MRSARRHTRSQCGSTLFLILLAVALFGALYVAVTGSDRGNKDSSGESTDAKAAALIQYGGLVANTVQRMRLMGSVPEWGFDFNDSTGPSSSNANATCTSSDCRLFNNGSLRGQIESQKFDESYVDPRARAAYPTHGGGSGTGTTFLVTEIVDVGTSQPDVIMIVPYVTPEICKSLNKILNNSYYNPTETYGGWVSYSGTLTSIPASIMKIGDEHNFYKGMMSGCIGREAPVNPAYGGDYFQVILVR